MPTAHFDRKSKWLIAVTLVLISAVIACGRFYVWKKDEFTRGQSRWETQVERESVRLKKANNEMHALLCAHGWSHAPTVDDLAKKLNQGEPFTLTQRGSRAHAEWQDPDTGITYDFSFLEGRWVSLHGKWPEQPSRPTPGKLYSQLQTLREGWAGWNRGWGPMIWLSLLLMFVFIRRLRRILSLALVVAGTACYIAWLIHYPLTVRGYFSNDMLVWGVGMILISTLIVTKLWQPEIESDNRFMQFRLRTMLVGVTVFGLLLAFGAYGVAVLITLIMCLILAAVVRAIDVRTQRVTND